MQEYGSDTGGVCALEDVGLGRFRLFHKKPRKGKAPATVPLPEELRGRDATLKDAFASVPWPHPFFASFLTNPLVPPQTPYYEGMGFSDKALLESGYFPRGAEEVDTDIAIYFFNNQDQASAHFQKNVEIIAAEEKKRAKRKAKRERWKQIAIMVLGTVLSVITGGVGAVVLAVVQSAYSVYSAKKQSRDTIKHAKALMKYLGIDEKRMDAFRLWLISHAKPDPEAPPTPDGVKPGRYSIFIEDNHLTSTDNINQGLKDAFNQAKVGDRIIVKDESDEQVVAVLLREEKGLRRVPADQASTVQALPKGSAERLAGGGGISIGYLAIPAALVLL